MQISLPLLRYLYLKKEKKLVDTSMFLWTPPKDLPGGPNLYVFFPGRKMPPTFMFYMLPVLILDS